MTFRWRSTLASLVILALAAAALPARAALPRAEHPRPDAVRDTWLNLNGEWQFEIDAKNDGDARGLASGKNLSGKITVPFCPESKLSGIAHTDHMKHVWYRRSFEVPAGFQGKRTLLHFDGVDWQSWVFLNGQPVGMHIGGNAPFAYDITNFLRPGQNELVVKVFDDTASGLQPTGKQSHGRSEGCVYTRTTGIWQTVWLEGVGSTYIENVSVVPDPDNSRILLDVATNGPDTGLKLVAEAFAEGKKVGSATIAAHWRNNRAVLDLSEKKLWEPGSPFLYDLKLSLVKEGQPVDSVQSYFGLRNVTIQGRAILINGKRFFQRLILDQGFYPDGIWTAPSDDELRKDIERSMACGYNGARLHQKVFEPRFLYWADKLGYMVWGEYPNWGYNHDPRSYAPIIEEWSSILIRDRNHPAIVGWCPFNETGGNAAELQQTIWKLTEAIDPTRPRLETSGWVHNLPNPEVRDAHDYDGNPAAFRTRWMNYFKPAASPLPRRYGSGSNRDRGVPFMVSEFGGIGWDTAGGWGYGAGPKTLDEFYTRYQGLVDAQLDNPNLFGFCYTQLTDVEQEHNGLYYYDRRPKFDLAKMKAITSRQAAYEKDGPTAFVPAPPERPWQVLVGAAVDGGQSRPYQYTTETPKDGWTSEKFDDASWKSGLAPFGNDIGGIRTKWNTPDVYLRRTFEYDGADFKDFMLVALYDDDTEVYVNGEKVWSKQGWTGSYQGFPVTDTLKKALKKGTNTLAIHTHQLIGGQIIDIAILGGNCPPLPPTGRRGPKQKYDARDRKSRASFFSSCLLRDSSRLRVFVICPLIPPRSAAAACPASSASPAPASPPPAHNSPAAPPSRGPPGNPS